MSLNEYSIFYKKLQGREDPEWRSGTAKSSGCTIRAVPAAIFRRSWHAIHFMVNLQTSEPLTVPKQNVSFSEGKKTMDPERNTNVEKNTFFPEAPEFIPIADLSAPELDVYARLSETELLRFYEPDRGLFIAESPKVIERALASGCRPVSMLCEEKQKEEAGRLTAGWPIPIYTAPFDVLTRLTGFALTRGLLCAMRRPEPLCVEQVCGNARRVAVLEQVMNPTNVGAIFRSAAALSMDAVLLTHGCSDPLYRRSIRVSMGTVFQIPWAFFPQKAEAVRPEKRTDWPEGGLRLLRSLGFRTVAMALREDSLSIDDPRLSSEEKLAIVLGSEGDGLSDTTIAACDYTVRIPMSHGVDSLNVAAASAVAFWQLGHGE